MPWGIAAAQEGVGGALQPYGSAQLNEAHRVFSSSARELGETGPHGGSGTRLSLRGLWGGVSCSEFSLTQFLRHLHQGSPSVKVLGEVWGSV